MIGFVADAHGNALGLEACLRTLTRMGARSIYFLGDAVGYLYGESEVLALLEAIGAVCLKGNHEAMLLGAIPLDPVREHVYGLARCRKIFSQQRLDTLAAWPERLEIDFDGRKCLLVHGSPENELGGYVYPDDDLSRFSGQGHDVVFMAHTHRPFMRREEQTLFVNVGSCGLPRDHGSMASCCLYDPTTGQARILRIPFDISMVASNHESLPLAPEILECLTRRTTPIIGETVGA